MKPFSKIFVHTHNPKPSTPRGRRRRAKANQNLLPEPQKMRQVATYNPKSNA